MELREYGNPSDPAVLLLHGQLLDGSMYAAAARRLAGSFRVLVPDLPGYGGSPLLRPYSLAAVEAELERQLAARGVTSASVVAYSLGTWHALAMALAGRVRVERLVLLGAFLGIDAPVKEAFRGYAGMARAGTKFGPIFAQMALPPAWAAEHPDAVREVVRSVDAVPSETLAAEFDAIGDLPDLRSRLGELRAPTLLRVGDADQNTPPAVSEAAAAAIPNAVLEVAPGVGHLYLVQDEAATLDSMARFLGA